MFIKKVEGPRTRQLPDGSVISLADLPPGNTVRWVASRKAMVIKAVASGLISKEFAFQKYSISVEEFESWCSAAREHGVSALKTTKLKSFRQL